MSGHSREFKDDQRESLPFIPTPEDCIGRTFVVTGANTGLGFECAKHLVALSAAKVILAVRTVDNGERAKATIEAETGIKGVAEVWQVELGSYDSVKSFAKKLSALDRLDVVIENASMALEQRTVTEGLETSLTVNVVSTFLLAALVLPKLQETGKKFGGQPHLVIVGSGAGFEGQEGKLEKIDGDIIDKLSDDPQGRMYPLTKLLQFYAVRQFASLRPVEDTGVVVNVSNPGFCVTELDRHVGQAIRDRIAAMRKELGRTAEAGSRNLLYAMVAGKQSHGKYTSECRIRDEGDRVPSWATNESGREIQKRVWDSLFKKLQAIQPGCI